MAARIHELIEPHAADAPAVIDHDGRRFSYGDLQQAVGVVERDLAARGVRRGDRVMLVCENCAANAAAVMAVSRLGAWSVPVNARHSEEELRQILGHSGARAMLFTSEVSVEAARHARAFGAGEAIALESGGLAVSPVFDVVPEGDSEVSTLLYTTGTTSAPKGVMLTHSNLIWNARASMKIRRMGFGDEVLAVLPGAHVFGFATTMLAALGAGASLRFISRFSPQAVLDALADGVSVFPAVPQMYERLLEHLHHSGAGLVAPRLHYISAGGAPLDPDLKERTEAVFGLPLQNGYGLTETTATVSVTRPEAPVDNVSTGPAVEGVRVWVEGADAGGVGELLVEGPGVMAGYYRNPEETARVMPRPGVFRTGDLCRLGPGGEIWVEGRVKELVIRSGFNVYPPEIEAMLTRHPLVTQAAVVGRRVGGNEEILAFVLAREGLDAAALADWLKTRLVAYKQPQHIFVVEAMPAAPTGKILKHKLVSHFAALLAARDAGAQGKGAGQ